MIDREIKKCVMSVILEEKSNVFFFSAAYSEITDEFLTVEYCLRPAYCECSVLLLLLLTCSALA